MVVGGFESRQVVGRKGIVRSQFQRMLQMLARLLVLMGGPLKVAEVPERRFHVAIELRRTPIFRGGFVETVQRHERNAAKIMHAGVVGMLALSGSKRTQRFFYAVALQGDQPS